MKRLHNMGRDTRRMPAVLGPQGPAVVHALGNLLLCLAAAALVSVTPFAALCAAEPFPIGERLIFQVKWNPPWYLFFLPNMEAGEAELWVSGYTEHKNTKALKIIFEARSSGTLVKLAGVKVDDRYEFITDPETFCTFSVAKKEREGKRQRDIDVLYLPESRRLHIREVDVAVDPPQVKKDKYVEDIPECVQDLFSALYELRRKEFFAGARYRATVGDNDRIKEIEIQVDGKERVETPAGAFEAWRVNTVALVGGLFREGGQFRMWLTADERKLPVRFEAKVKLGKVEGRLTGSSYQGLAQK